MVPLTIFTILIHLTPLSYLTISIHLIKGSKFNITSVVNCASEGYVNKERVFATTDDDDDDDDDEDDDDDDDDDDDEFLPWAIRRDAGIKKSSQKMMKRLRTIKLNLI